MSKTNRRTFLMRAAPVAAAPFLLPILSRELIAHGLEARSTSTIAPVQLQRQGDWRYCDKCSVLFFSGAANKGHCQAGGEHESQGYSFFLPYGNLPETPKSQNYWRFCDKCFEMFFDFYPNKGRCPAGGGHHSQGFLFSLPHDVNVDANNQGGWRFCQKCFAMFYDGYQSKGNCPAGGGHVAQGFQFVLPHGPTPDIHLHADLRTNGTWNAIGGWVDIVAKQNGDYVFSGHMHNSGAVNLRYTLAVLLWTPDAQGFGFGVNDHQVDGTETIFNRKRDDDWKVERNDARIAQNWNQVSQARLVWQLASSTTGIVRALENMARDVGGLLYCVVVSL